MSCKLRVVLSCAIFVAASLLCAAPARCAVTAEAVREAIEQGVASLQKAQNRSNGSWPQYSAYQGGATALAALALLNAGVPADDPSVRMALKYLRQIGNPQKTYPTSLQTMVFCTASPESDRLAIRRNVRWLESTQVKTGNEAGGWGYGISRHGMTDESNSQFALLGLHEAERVGVAVNKNTWRLAVDYWKSKQLGNGAWRYRGSDASGSMTCAGIASMVIGSRNLTRGDAWILEGRVICCGMQEDDDSIQRGLAWLGRNFSVNRNPSPANRDAGWLLYYLYGVERVGRMTGRRFIGDHDWYREGAEMLVSQQDVLSGAWQETRFSQRRDISTAMALLFLAKGRRPVLISKLRYRTDKDWNRHREDVGNLTRYMESRWRRDMTWQIIDQRAASVEDLLQTPVLFMSGRDGFTMNADQKQKLRDYVIGGGFIFAEACCGGAAFDNDFRNLLAELFPDNPLRLLPPDHPVWYAEERVSPEHVRPLMGIDTCCRTSVVYCPRDLGCYWELARARGVEYPRKIQDEVDAVLAIGANVLAYATNRELRDKLDTPIEMADEAGAPTIQRGALAVAKLQHGGGSDDAPAALANLLRVAADQLDIRVNTQRKMLTPTDPLLPDFPVLFLHGRRDFRWSDTEHQALAEFLRNGGVIFGDAICSNEQFAAAFRREMTAVCAEAEMQRVPPEHPLFTSAFKGFDISQVGLRKLRARRADDPLAARIDRVSPVLEGIEQDGRYVVLFSPYDISCALESPVSMDCPGYVREDAARIGMNVLLYALQQ